MSISGGSKPKKKGRVLPIPPDSNIGDWVIVALSQFGEKEKNLEAIKKSSLRLLRRALEVFIPAKTIKVREEEQVNFYLDGYIFIKYEDGVDYTRLNDTPLFSNVLVKRLRNAKGERYFVYCLVKDKELEPLRARMEAAPEPEFKIGDSILIRQGTYKNLQGVISSIYDDGKNCQIKVDLRSKCLLVDFPISYVTKTVKED